MTAPHEITAVSFCTDGCYEPELSGLWESCRQFGVTLYSEVLPPRRDWRANCAMKPEFIRRMMVKFEGQPILWIDADARVVSDLNLPEWERDIYARVRFRPNGSREVLSGTIFIRPTQKAWQTVCRWCALQRNQQDVWDQRVLDQALRENHCAFGELPTRLCAIFDEQPAVEDPTILHYQASRRLKHLMKRPVMRPMFRREGGMRTCAYAR